MSMTDKPKPDINRKLKVYERTKDERPMRFALLSKDPSPEELQQFVDFLNGEGEFAHEGAPTPTTGDDSPKGRSRT